MVKIRKRGEAKVRARKMGMANVRIKGAVMV